MFITLQIYAYSFKPSPSKKGPVCACSKKVGLLYSCRDHACIDSVYQLARPFFEGPSLRLRCLIPKFELQACIFATVKYAALYKCTIISYNLITNIR